MTDTMNDTLPLPGTPWAAWRADVAHALCLTEWDVEYMESSYIAFNTLVTPDEFADAYREGLDS